MLYIWNQIHNVKNLVLYLHLVIYRTSQKPHVGETRCPCAPTTIKKHMKSADQTALEACMNWIGASIYDIAKNEINQNFVPRKIKKKANQPLQHSRSGCSWFKQTPPSAASGLAVKCVRRYLPSVRTLLRFRRPPPVTGQHCISAIRRVAFVVRQPGTRVRRTDGRTTCARTCLLRLINFARPRLAID